MKAHMHRFSLGADHEIVVAKISLSYIRDRPECVSYYFTIFLNEGTLCFTTRTIELVYTTILDWNDFPAREREDA